VDARKKRPDLAMGRRPIALSEESALASIEEVRLLFSRRKPTNSMFAQLELDLFFKRTSLATTYDVA
jgi:hypothetical protein